MTPGIIEHKTDYVTTGVLDKGVDLQADWQSVTYEDVFGAVHTVYAHKHGPFTSPDEIVAAAQNGTLHVFDSHEAAAAYETDRGNHAVAERLSKLGSREPRRDEQQGDGDY